MTNTPLLEAVANITRTTGDDRIMLSFEDHNAARLLCQANRSGRGKIRIVVYTEDPTEDEMICIRTLLLTYSTVTDFDPFYFFGQHSFAPIGAMIHDGYLVQANHSGYLNRYRLTPKAQADLAEYEAEHGPAVNRRSLPRLDQEILLPMNLKAGETMPMTPPQGVDRWVYSGVLGRLTAGGYIIWQRPEYIYAVQPHLIDVLKLPFSE